ncbi:MAG TPA: hypothetical protein VJK48_03505 [Chlamydiales bacterium]|nr:hypothetical protein [Chlamydiales bacterium]
MKLQQKVATSLIAGGVITIGAVALGVGTTALNVAAFAKFVFIGAAVCNIACPVVPAILIIFGTFVLCIGIGLAVRYHLQHKPVPSNQFNSDL